MTNKPSGNSLKLWIALYKDDIFKTIKLLVPIFLLIFIVGKIPALTRSYLLLKMDAETIAIIDKIDKRKGIRESETGGKIIVKDYKIQYHYQVDSISINQSEIIPITSINLKQKTFLNNLNIGDSVCIKYNSTNLNTSKLALSPSN